MLPATDTDECLERLSLDFVIFSIVFIDLIERLRIAVERRSPKADMVPRSRLEEAENELTIRNQVRLTSQLSLYLGVSDYIKI